MLILADKSNDNKKSLKILEGDWINYIQIGYEEGVCLLYMKTYKGKNLSFSEGVDPVDKKA